MCVRGSLTWGSNAVISNMSGVCCQGETDLLLSKIHNNAESLFSLLRSVWGSLTKLRKREYGVKETSWLNCSHDSHYLSFWESLSVIWEKSTNIFARANGLNILRVSYKVERTWGSNAVTSDMTDVCSQEDWSSVL